jgi:hypothetical protein
MIKGSPKYSCLAVGMQAHDKSVFYTVSLLAHLELGSILIKKTFYEKTLFFYTKSKNGGS